MYHLFNRTISTAAHFVYITTAIQLYNYGIHLSNLYKSSCRKKLQDIGEVVGFAVRARVEKKSQLHVVGRQLIGVKCVAVEEIGVYVAVNNNKTR